ncbi:thermonuclease family protein [Roseibacterium sp. SDUM158016]|uniref:thermonuclease family protein n=1 Tax=Roseicyclus sediminis TaxID=2980997 RepID=UPI0021CF45F5|nr:thermonuclease family protein [Roseibacterium sp. SDUM158016]MCU4653674.1 thermonuclease family protein [Roseibacterium sp. SDUM158016]
MSPHAAGADASFHGPYSGEVLRVIDGDTFETRVEIWPNIEAVVSVRLRGFDAPELFRPDCEEERLQATLAKAVLEELLPVGQEVRLEDVEAGAFSGRVVATVDRVAEANAVNLGILLERRGFVRWEPGDPDIDWCAGRGGD